jgi:diguanylate cyclase
MGCETVQGFVFAHPMFEEEYLDWTSNADRSSRDVA